MERLFRYLRGYVWILIKGERLERFLNLCRSRGICMERISRSTEGEICARISVKDFFRLRSIRQKTKVHIQVNKKQGLPFFFWKNKKRKAFFAGIFLCLMILIFLSGHIWNIHVEGNTKYSTQEILAFLKEQDIFHGISRKKVNCLKLAEAVRKKYPEFVWVSAKIRGCRLILQVQEGTKEEQKEVWKTPCDLKAGQSGTIVQMITRSGVPVKKIGDTCKTGELLVSGELHILNDSQEIVRYEYVHADADVYIQRSLSYYREFPLDYEEKILTGKHKTAIAMKVGRWNINLYSSRKENWKMLMQEYQMRITENFFLPCSLTKVTFVEYKKQKKSYTQEQAEEIAKRELIRYEKKLLEKDMQIAKTNVHTKMTDTACITQGTVTVIEKTGISQEINTRERQNSYLKSDEEVIQ